MIIARPNASYKFVGMAASPMPGKVIIIQINQGESLIQGMIKESYKFVDTTIL
jgi:hypothetical protein